MPPRRSVQLLLSSPLGLLEYDVLEEAAFLGPDARGGVKAAATPFPEAVAALTHTPEGWVVRPLPGEVAPRVNGQPTTDLPLPDGARIEIGGRVCQFRSDAVVPPPAPPPAAPPGASQATAARAGTGRRRAAVRLRANPWAQGLALLGALLLLGAAYRAVAHLSLAQESRDVAFEVPPPPRVGAQGPQPFERARRDLEAARAFERENQGGPLEAVARYRNVLKTHADAPEAEAARARIRELLEGAAEVAYARLSEDVARRTAGGDFAGALEAIRAFERRYAATAVGPRGEELHQEVRAAARGALDDLRARVGPMVVSDPRAAHRLLVAQSHAFPPDLSAELVALMERAIELMRSQGRAPPAPAPSRAGSEEAGSEETGPEPRRPPGEAPYPDGPSPDAPAKEEPPPRPETPPPQAGPATPAEVRALWAQAHGDLHGGRSVAALQGYERLLQEHAGHPVVEENQRAIEAGHKAARALLDGPGALLSVPTETKRGRLEVEYVFSDPSLMDLDFTVEKPFPSELEQGAEAKPGVIHLSGSTALLHALVWTSDVRIEVDMTLDGARDVGVVAIEEGADLRAIALTLANSRMMLREGAQARPNPGHVLWIIGGGAWRDADPNRHGYIKIAERTTVKLKDGDRGTVGLERRGDRVEAEYHGSTDGVSLKGKAVGDDGKGLGSARVGPFVNGGRCRVHRLRLSGKVDATWFGEVVENLKAQASGPP